MKLLSTILALAISLSLHAQTDTTKKVQLTNASSNRSNDHKKYIQAKFPGGMEAWIDYLQRNLKNQLAAKYLNPPKGQTITQIAIVSFKIDSLGNTFDIKIDNPDQVHPKLAEESIRVIKESPKWIPASIDDINVVFSQRQSITWTAQAE